MDDKLIWSNFYSIWSKVNSEHKRSKGGQDSLITEKRFNLTRELISDLEQTGVKLEICWFYDFEWLNKALCQSRREQRALEKASITSSTSTSPSSTSNTAQDATYIIDQSETRTSAKTNRSRVGQSSRGDNVEANTFHTLQSSNASQHSSKEKKKTPAVNRYTNKQSLRKSTLSLKKPRNKSSIGFYKNLPRTLSFDQSNDEITRTSAHNDTNDSIVASDQLNNDNVDPDFLRSFAIISGYDDKFNGEKKDMYGRLPALQQIVLKNAETEQLLKHEELKFKCEEVQVQRAEAEVKKLELALRAKQLKKDLDK